MEDIQLILARNLKAYRSQKKLSLEKVAELTGVSKTMIRQIELGESSPTITTTWKIAKGLNVSFSSLIDNPRPDIKLYPKSEIRALHEDKGKYRLYPTFSFQEEKHFEMYFVEIDQNGFLSAEAHQEGTEEYITVFEGELTISVNDKKFRLQKGDSISFQADRPHSYHNAGEELTKLNMTIYYR